MKSVYKTLKNRQFDCFRLSEGETKFSLLFIQQSTRAKRVLTVLISHQIHRKL